MSGGDRSIGRVIPDFHVDSGGYFCSPPILTPFSRLEVKNPLRRLKSFNRFTSSFSLRFESSSSDTIIICILLQSPLPVDTIAGTNFFPIVC